MMSWVRLSLMVPKWCPAWWRYYKTKNFLGVEKCDFRIRRTFFENKMSRFVNFWGEILHTIPLEISLRATARGFESHPLRQRRSKRFIVCSDLFFRTGQHGAMSLLALFRKQKQRHGRFHAAALGFLCVLTLGKDNQIALGCVHI